MDIPVGTFVSVVGSSYYGVTTSEVVETPTGFVVEVQYANGSGHPLGVGSHDVRQLELPTPLKPKPVKEAIFESDRCQCLRYFAIIDEETVTTVCDPMRAVSAGRKFLPGHDAKLKSFLIKAGSSGAAVSRFGVLGDRSALEVARDFGFSVQVAAGIQRQSDKWRRSADATEARIARRQGEPAPELTATQKLRKQLKVTDVMLRNLAYALTQRDGEIPGNTPTGQIVALQQRKLVSWGHVTRLGRLLMDYPPLAPNLVVCRDEDGNEYSGHVGYYDCKHCGGGYDANE